MFVDSVRFGFKRKHFFSQKKKVMCDKALQTMFVDNGNHYCSPTVQAKITKSLKQLGLPQARKTLLNLN